jgi:acyl-CoA thioester hydrolase
MTANRFEHKITIENSDIDELGHVNNVVYVRWVQEVAAAHWATVASPALRDRHKWVVLRHEIDYKSPAFRADDLTGITWVGENHGPRFERFVQVIRRKDARVIVEAKTVWCMIDAQTLRPQRIGPDVLQIL